MELRQLEYFRVIAETESIHEAARRLFPGASMPRFVPSFSDVFAAQLSVKAAGSRTERHFI